MLNPSAFTASRQRRGVLNRAGSSRSTLQSSVAAAKTEDECIAASGTCSSAQPFLETKAKSSPSVLKTIIGMLLCVQQMRSAGVPV